MTAPGKASGHLTAAPVERGWFDAAPSGADLPAEPEGLAETFIGPRPVPDPPAVADELEDLDAEDLVDVGDDVPRGNGAGPHEPMLAAEFHALTDPRDPPDPADLASEQERLARVVDRADAWRSTRGLAASLERAGYTTVADYLEAMDLPAADPPPAVAVPGAGAPPRTERPGRAVLILAEMLAAEIPTPPSRVAGLLPGEGFGIIAGPRKHGKTLTELQLGLCVAGGIPFLGRAVEQTPVLIIEEEGAARAMQDRLRSQVEALGVPADAPLHIAHRQRFRLDHPADVDAIDELIASTGAGLVIIGPLAQVASIDENSNSADGMGPIVRTMTGLAARHRALVKLVHHLRKPAGAPQAPKTVDEFFYRVRGADALVAGVDVALGLWREPEATEGTLYVLARDGENVRIPLLFDARSLTFSVNPEPDDPMAADVVRFVERLAQRPGRWHTRAELEGATGWGKTKVLSVGMYAFGEGRAQQRSMARNAREWRVADASLGIVE